MTIAPSCQRVPAVTVSLLAFLLAGCVDDTTPTDPSSLDDGALFDVQAHEGSVEYEVVILAPDLVRSVANAINPEGVIVGSTQPSGVPGPTFPFLWRDGELVVGVEPAVAAADINAEGTVVGFVSHDTDAAIWARERAEGGFGEYHLLPIGYPTKAQATAINDVGNIVGGVRFGERDHHFFWEDADSPPRLLKPLEDFEVGSAPRSISNAGYVPASNSRWLDGRPVREAVVWRVGDGEEVVLPVKLPYLGGRISDAEAVNQQGDAVGSSAPADETSFRQSAVLWRYSGNGVWDHPIDLHPSRNSSAAFGITNRLPDGSLGIVGNAYSNHGPRAMIWTVDLAGNVQTQALPLPSSYHRNRSTSSARAVNDKGWIVGWVKDHDTEIVAALWRPVGEPSEPPPPPADGDLQAGFTYSCGNGSTCQFTDTSSGDPSAWSWTFDGGNPTAATSPNPSTTFSSAGTHTAKLEVSREGEASSTVHTISCRQQGPNLRCR